MVYKNFYITFIINILIFSLILFSFFFLLMQEESYYITLTMLGFAALIQLYFFYKQFDKIIRQITYFFESIKYSDFSYDLRLPYKGKLFNNLNDIYGKVAGNYKETHIKLEEQFQFFRYIVEHVDIGLIVFDADWKISLVNNAAKRILKITNEKNLDQVGFKYDKLAVQFKKINDKEKFVYKIETNEGIIQIIICAFEFNIMRSKYKLLALQNIQNELQQNEYDSWDKLIHVLTHEIMNSLTPINSLASTTKFLIEESMKSKTIAPAGDLQIQDIYKAIQTIEKRSIGLQKFVQKYREIKKTPSPEYSVFFIEDMFKRLEDLWLHQIKNHNINFSYSIQPPKLDLTADIHLIEQLLINLFKNSIEALSDTHEKKIKLTAAINDQGRTIIQVIDNGKGIPMEKQDTIFVPFFSTKIDGKGIGLNFCRQVMSLHNGFIHFKSEPGVTTVFTLVF